MTACEGDETVGGTFQWAWNGPDGKPALSISGVNREVITHQKLVHTESMAMGDGVPIGELLATIELNEQEGRTSLRMTLLFDCKEARDGALASGMSRGVSAGYETLDQLLIELG